MTPVGDHANQAKHMVTMQVTDEDMIAAIRLYPIPKDLHLCPLSTIDQKRMVFNLQNLRRVVPPVEWAAGGIA